MMFVGFSNLVEFTARFSTSRQDWKDCAVKFASFLIGQDLVEILKDKLLTEIAEISRRSHHVCEFLNLGKIKNEISSILPRSH